MPKGFTDAEKDAIRARLLAAGEKQFSAYGLKKTNVAELAAAATISKGAFYLFYDSKEALFMEVAEQVEQRYRQDMLAALAQPGPTPRARLLAALQTGFHLLHTMPILQIATSSDFEQLMRRVPPESVQAHVASDHAFLAQLIAHGQAVGVPITAPPEVISSLLYPLVLAAMHADAAGPRALGGSLDRLLDLVAAYCVGEVTSDVGAESSTP